MGIYWDKTLLLVLHWQLINLLVEFNRCDGILWRGKSERLALETNLIACWVVCVGGSFV